MRVLVLDFGSVGCVKGLKEGCICEGMMNGEVQKFPKFEDLVLKVLCILRVHVVLVLSQDQAYQSRLFCVFFL